MPLWMTQQLVPSAEFTEWLALEELDPWGQRRMDIHFARLLAMQANTWRDVKKRPEPFGYEDFLLEYRFGELQAELTDPTEDPEAEARRKSEELWRKIAAANAALGGKVLTRRDN